MKLIKQLVQLAIALKKLWLKDRKRGFPVPWNKRISCWKAGFLPESYVIYDFVKNDQNLYLSDLARLWKAPHIHSSRGIVLDDKFLFHYAFKHTNKLVPPIAQIEKGSIIDHRSNNSQMLEKSSFKELLKVQACVFKPYGGGGGANIYFISYNGNWNVNGNIEEEGSLDQLMESFSGFLVYPNICQQGFASKINANSVNTIRLLTMIDPSNGRAFIPIAVIRFGSKQSGQVDNWSSGGYSALIDLETGAISKAISFPINGRLEWIHQHPDTHFAFHGLEIPYWDRLKKEMLEIAQGHSFLPYVGWDIVPMEDDYIILEGNSNSDVNLLQVHQPLLQTPRVRNFFKHHGVI